MERAKTVQEGIGMACIHMGGSPSYVFYPSSFVQSILHGKILDFYNIYQERL